MLRYKEYTKLLNESGASRSLSRVWQHTQGMSNVGMITAFRGEYSEKQNKLRNKKLANEIKTNKFGYIHVIGNFIEDYGTDDARKVEEASFFITSNPNDGERLKNFLIKMGKKFNQDSIFYKPHDSKDSFLIGTSSGKFPGMGKEIKIGSFHPSKMGEFYTKMKGHKDKVFTFESFQSK